MIRALFAVVAGVALAWLGIALLTGFVHAAYPLPSGIDPADRTAFAAAVAQVPARALGLILAAWALGTFVGAWLAARIAGRAFYASLVGGVMMLAGVKMLVQTPHPWWFTAAGIALFLPSGWLAGRLSARLE